MTYIGRHQLGNHVPFMVNPVDGNRVTTLPDAAPVWTMIRLSTGATIATGQLAPDWDSATPVFRYAKFLTGVTPGFHAIVVRYAVSGTAHIESFLFEVVPGGNAYGAITTVYPYNRGEEQYLFHSTDAGDIFAGKRPRLPQ